MGLVKEVQHVSANWSRDIQEGKTCDICCVWESREAVTKGRAPLPPLGLDCNIWLHWLGCRQSAVPCVFRSSCCLKRLWNVFFFRYEHPLPTRYVFTSKRWNSPTNSPTIDRQLSFKPFFSSVYYAMTAEFSWIFNFQFTIKDVESIFNSILSQTHTLESFRFFPGFDASGSTELEPAATGGEGECFGLRY